MTKLEVIMYDVLSLSFIFYHSLIIILCIGLQVATSHCPPPLLAIMGHYILVIIAYYLLAIVGYHPLVIIRSVYRVAGRHFQSPPLAPPPRFIVHNLYDLLFIIYEHL